MSTTNKWRCKNDNKISKMTKNTTTYKYNSNITKNKNKKKSQISDSPFDATQTIHTNGNISTV